MHESTETAAPKSGGEREYGVGQPKGFDLDPSRRPGTPRLHAPKKLPNALYPPERQRSVVKVYMHGRPHKTFPPVFGTACPPKGLSGLLRRAAYHYPDHYMRHWTMLLLSDRVDAMEHRLKKVSVGVAPLLAVFAVGAGVRAWLRD
jgi:hypothetical protein